MKIVTTIIFRSIWRNGKFVILSVVHWENYISISFYIEWDMIVVTIFILIFNQMEFHLVENRKKNCHLDRIPFNVNGNGNIVFSMRSEMRERTENINPKLCCCLEIGIIWEANRHNLDNKQASFGPQRGSIWATKRQHFGSKEAAFVLKQACKSNSVLPQAQHVHYCPLWSRNLIGLSIITS